MCRCTMIMQQDLYRTALHWLLLATLAGAGCHGFLSPPDHPLLRHRFSASLRFGFTKESQRPPNKSTIIRISPTSINDHHHDQDEHDRASKILTDEIITLPSFANDSDDSYPSRLHHIYVKSIMSDEQAAKALQLAHEHAAQTGRWNQPDSDRHATYATCDFPVEDCPDLNQYLEDEVGVTDQIFEHLTECFGLEYDDLTYLDFFVAHYEAQEQEQNNNNDDNNNHVTANTMDRLEAHRDGSLLSFTVTLTPPEQFEGGGTFFEALRQIDNDEVAGDSLPSSNINGVVRPNRAGDAVLHCGKILHGADVVTRGSRTVLVGFVDVAEWRTRAGVLGKACREWGRMDVAQRRHDRQEEQLSSLAKQSSSVGHRWPRVHPKSFKWLPHDSKSHLQLELVPAFGSVQRRADKGFQRSRRLQVEDVFLQNILLPKGEKREVDDIDLGEWIPVESGDFTIL